MEMSLPLTRSRGHYNLSPIPLSSSAYSAPPQGVDYVDYGAYTGKHGAFGWYSDHPVCLNCH